MSQDLERNKQTAMAFYDLMFNQCRPREAIEKYAGERYIQHNPRVPTGRQAFVDFFSKIRKPSPIEPRVKAPLVAILADGDLVTLAFVREYPAPGDLSRKYTTTWFDMFRIVDGKIAEHWDPATKQ